MNSAKQRKTQETPPKDVPRGGVPGDGAGRIEDPGAQGVGVFPASGSPSGNPDARFHDMASFGQGERGAAGYEDSGQSEVVTMPPGDGPASGRNGSKASIQARGFGDTGSNAGEVDPGIGGKGDTIGETPDGAGGGAGFGNAVGGGGAGDVPQTADRPAR